MLNETFGDLTGILMKFNWHLTVAVLSFNLCRELETRLSKG
jgi:hypothetical protein